MISNLVTTNLQFGGGVQVLWNQSNQVEISDPTSIFVNLEDCQEGSYQGDSEEHREFGNKVFENDI